MELQLKQHKGYWFYRIYCMLVVGVWNGIGVWQFYRHFFQHEKELPVNELYLAPFVIPAIFMCFSWMVFPFKYSVFGRFERTPFPQERPVFKWIGSWGRIWLVPASIPFFNWYVYDSGLGISILFVGKVFIPVEQIESMKKGFFTGYILHHTSPELRNPVILPSSQLYKAVYEIVTKHEHRLHS